MAQFGRGFEPIDVLEVARWQHGPAAELWEPPTHAYGWAARKPGESVRYPLDLHRFVAETIGGDWRVVQSNFGPSGWQRFDPFDPGHDWSILPVILVASDRLADAAAIKAGVDNFRHNVASMADWYEAQLGRRLKLLEPHLFASRHSSEDWYRIYQDQADRFDLWKVCQDEILSAYSKRINGNIIYVVTEYCGDTPEWDWDAAGGVLTAGTGWLAVVSSFACCHCYSPNTTGNTWDETIIYAVAHEVGHCLGLPHTPDEQAGADRSIMRRGMPPLAILTEPEKLRLVDNPFLRDTMPQTAGV